MSIAITSRFDGGAIEVVDLDSKPDLARLRIRPDTAADFAQWFYFRASGVGARSIRYVFENAGECAYAEGWRDYRVAASYDGQTWFRIDTDYDGQTLQFSHRAEHDSIYYAYFEPYGEARHQAFMGRVQASGLARVENLGPTIEGRPLDLVSVGSGEPVIWIIARQHPGETMAEWFAEGLLKRLLGFDDWRGDPVGRVLRSLASFRIVPNMNPDGAALGNLRTNAAGANLNREWLEPDRMRSPEVLAVRRAIEAGRCDMFFDIHGDEVLPYVFVAGSEMLPDFNAEQAAQQQRFVARFKALSPDFQDEFGYAADKYQSDALKLASKYIAHRFHCLSLTLEMPFKDNADLPDSRTGWDGARSAALGAAMLGAILDELRISAHA